MGEWHRILSAFHVAADVRFISWWKICCTKLKSLHIKILDCIVMHDSIDSNFSNSSILRLPEWFTLFYIKIEHEILFLIWIKALCYRKGIIDQWIDTCSSEVAVVPLYTSMWYRYWKKILEKLVKTCHYGAALFEIAHRYKSPIASLKIANRF